MTDKPRDRAGVADDAGAVARRVRHVTITHYKAHKCVA